MREMKTVFEETKRWPERDLFERYPGKVEVK